ncbi:hypothetical protein GW17_00055489 [Ensete ventricosum]|nr:hypothetical protein GW17_00055489 [Ensete ventricosum]
MDPFLEKFFPDVYADMKDSRTSNYYMFDSQLLIAFTSALYIVGLFASFCASKVMQAFNHRASMLLGGAVFLVGDVLGGLAIIIFVLILGRILLDVGVGFTKQAYFTGSPGNIAAHCQRRASAAHLLADKLKSSSGAGLLTFTEMPDVINSLARNSKANSVTDALHSAADFFCSLSSPSSTVLSPQPRVMLPDLLDGAISCFLPRHRSVGMGDLLLPPSTQICNRSPASSLDTDLRSLCGLVRLQDSTASGRVWQPPEPGELRPILLLLLLQRCLEEPQSFSFPASKRQWTYRFILHI